MTLNLGRPGHDVASGSSKSETRHARVHRCMPIVRVDKWSAGLSATGNRLIQGDNLRVLEALSTQYVDSVRCAYLDPPYNNGETYQHYFDNMGHAEWLHSVAERLRKIRTLLTADGSVWISIDDSEVHYLKVAADEIFGRDNFIGTIVWERRTSRENRRVLSRNHEYLLAYAKDLSKWERFRNPLPITPEVANRYRNPDADPRGPWQSVSANVQAGHATPQQFYALKAPNGRIHEVPKGRCWVYTKQKMMDEIAKGNVWFGVAGTSVPRLKRFLSERKTGLTPNTLWRADEVGTTSDAKKQLLAIFQEETLFDTPKPEALIHRILQISTNPGDLVLDPYLGSGTTTAVAHKMNRAYIGIEIGDHIKTHSSSRMRSVIAGESGGVSRLLSWSGGGGFDFYRLTVTD